MMTLFCWVIGILIFLLIVLPAIVVWTLVYLSKKADDMYVRPGRRPF